MKRVDVNSGNDKKCERRLLRTSHIFIIFHALRFFLTLYFNLRRHDTDEDKDTSDVSLCRHDLVVDKSTTHRAEKRLGGKDDGGKSLVVGKLLSEDLAGVCDSRRADTAIKQGNHCRLYSRKGEGFAGDCRDDVVNTAEK